MDEYPSILILMDELDDFFYKRWIELNILKKILMYY